MLKTKARMIFGLVAGGAVLIALALSPQLAQADTLGALGQLGSPNNCIEATDGGNECQTTGQGLNGDTNGVAVTPDDKNVYVISAGDDAIAEFTRNADGTLTWLGCIADDDDSDSTCTNQPADAHGLEDLQAIVANNQNVYVVGQDSAGNGTIAELTRNTNGTLGPLSGSECIAENVEVTDEESPCDSQSGLGIRFPSDLAIAPDGKDVYVVDTDMEDIVQFARAADGSLSEPNGCIEDSSLEGGECTPAATGLQDPTSVAVSPDNENVYTAGSDDESGNGTIAEFARASNGTLSQLDSPYNCVENPNDNLGCGKTAIGMVETAGLIVSPDGQNVYVASEEPDGPIAEFSRVAGGGLQQLPAPDDCIQEANAEQDFGCHTEGVGIGGGYQLAISQDGTSVYAAAPNAPCFSSDGCSDVAEFSRDAATGALRQLAGPDSCIQDVSEDASECPGNESGTGLGGAGMAISADGNNVYVTGQDDVAEFARAANTLTVSVAGSGSGGASDVTGAIACPTTCSSSYTTGTVVTLTATPASGSTFAGWSGACSGTGTCQVTVNADTSVTATFTATSAPTAEAPTPVLTGAPTAVTDSGAGFSGSVNPEGLPTTVYFQYGLDKRYTQVGAAGPDYTGQTPSQQVATDFATHGVGPVAISGLVPNALYHVRLVATNSAGTTLGQDVTFTTGLAPAPSAPTPGQTFNIAPVSGVVIVYIHGHPVPLTQLEQIGPGDVLDTRHGTLQLTISVSGGGSARDAAAHGKTKTQTGQFGGGVFRLHQATRGATKGLTTVMMVESAFKGAPAQSICSAPASAADGHAAKINTKVIQLLHASAHGKFATSGRYSAATVRGTVWTMIARCDGTLVKDIKDEVVVTDFIRHKTIVLHAGQSYLAGGPPK
jgi:hypothetical protein